MDATRDKDAWRAKYLATSEALARVWTAELAAMSDEEGRFAGSTLDF